METYQKSGSENIISTREVINILFLRKTTIISVFAGVVLIAGFLSFYFISPNYEAGSTIIINSSDLVVPMVDAPPISDFEKLTSFNTQKDIIMSSTIITRVVDSLKLDKNRAIGNYENLKLFLKDVRRWFGNFLGIKSWQKEHDPRAASIAAILDAINITSKPESRALKITYTAKNPVEAQQTLNALINIYRDYFNDMIQVRAAGITDYLNMQLSEVEANLGKAEKALYRFRSSDKLNLNVLKDSKNKAKNEEDSRSLIGITDSPEVQKELKLYILSMEEELRKMTTEYTESHPNVIALRKKIERYVDALNKMPGKELELLRLQRDIKIHQDEYMFLRKNLDKAKIVEASNSGKINIITVLEKAEVDENPVSPKPRLTMVLAIIFGIVFGVVCALVQNFLDHTIRSVQDVERYFGLRVLGSLKKIE